MWWWSSPLLHNIWFNLFGILFCCPFFFCFELHNKNNVRDTIVFISLVQSYEIHSSLHHFISSPNFRHIHHRKVLAHKQKDGEGAECKTVKWAQWPYACVWICFWNGTRALHCRKAMIISITCEEEDDAENNRKFSTIQSFRQTLLYAQLIRCEMCF